MSNTQPPAAPAINPVLEAFIARACADGWIDLGELLPFAEAMRAAFPSPAPAPVEPPPPCDTSIFQKGVVVSVLEGGMLAVEGLVKEASRHGPEMDWHYVGGRAVIKTLGDPLRAHAALVRSIPRILQGAA